MLNSGGMVHGGCSMFLIDVYVFLLSVTARTLIHAFVALP